MIYNVIAVLYLLLPIGALIGNGRLWHRKLGAGALFGATCLAGYLLLLVATQVLPQFLLNRHDLNGDGEFSLHEQTPKMREDMAYFANDTGRSFVWITGGPTTLIVYGFPFLVAGIAGRVRRSARARPAKSPKVKIVLK